MKRYLLFVVSCAAGIMASSGCTLSDAGCESDEECYLDRVCLDGVCTGEGALEPGPNNVGNNVSVNNVGNNQNNVGNNQNNVTDQCESSDECAGDLVCAQDGADPNGLQCLEPWFFCDTFIEQSERECFFEFQCNMMELRVLTCEFGDEDQGTCFCFGPEGEVAQFPSDRSICGDPDRAVDDANRECLWRVPRP